MAPCILVRKQQGSSHRRRAVRACDGEYFAGEAIRILGLQHLDYDQLHRLFEVIRGRSRAADEKNSWRRFTFADLASLKVAASLIGLGHRKTRRLRLKQLAAVCNHLREELGIEHPLLQARLRGVGSTIVVQLDGNHFDSSVTQRVFDEIAVDVAKYEGSARLSPIHAAARRALSKSRAASSEVYEAPALAVARRK